MSPHGGEGDELTDDFANAMVGLSGRLTLLERLIELAPLDREAALEELHNARAAAHLGTRLAQRILEERARCREADRRPTSRTTRT